MNHEETEDQVERLINEGMNCHAWHFAYGMALTCSRRVQDMEEEQPFPL